MTKGSIVFQTDECDVIDTSRPAFDEFLLARLPCNDVIHELDSRVVDFVEKPFGVACVQCRHSLWAYNTILLHTEDALRYLDATASACPYPIDKNVRKGLTLDFVRFPLIPEKRLEDIAPLFIGNVTESCDCGDGIAF